MASCKKWWSKKDAVKVRFNDWLDRSYVTWGSLLDTIELIILYAFICIIEYLDVEIGETLMYKYTSSENVTTIYMEQNYKHRAFLTMISILSVQIIP